MGGEKDSVRESYERVTPFFYWFSRLFENRARVKSLKLSDLKNGDSILIIAPPTEYYLDKLLEANPDGENHLVYFSEHMKCQAEKRLQERYTCVPAVGSLEKLPYDNDRFDVVFAYCYLDFLDHRERRTAVEEIRRVLRWGGRLLATYLASPHNTIETVCASLVVRLDFLSGSLRVVEVEPVLEQVGFKNTEVLCCHQKGLPVELAYAQK